jgi:hypothetical protein
MKRIEIVNPMLFRQALWTMLDELRDYELENSFNNILEEYTTQENEISRTDLKQHLENNDIEIEDIVSIYEKEIIKYIKEIKNPSDLIQISIASNTITMEWQDEPDTKTEK